MSLENFSACLPPRQTFQAFQISTRQLAPLIFPEEIHIEKSLPSSPSSSTVSSNHQEDDIKSWPDEVASPYSPATIYSSAGLSSAGTPMNQSPLTSLLEPQTACYKVFNKTNPFSLKRISKQTEKRKNDFTPQFYKRIEDYLDQLGLNFTMPSDHKDANIDKSSIRKLIHIKNISEYIPDNQETSIGTESSDVGSPGLKNNIGASALILRRASLSHTSPTELEAARQAMIVKKSIFHTSVKVADEIFEENESPFMSKHNSALLATAPKSPIKLSAMLQESRWDDNMPDVQSALSRKSSSMIGNGLSIKSPVKISPMIKSGSFGRLPPLNLFNSQIDLKSSTIKSALDLSTKNLKYTQDMESVSKKDLYGVASFAEILSNSSESSICNSPVSLQQQDKVIKNEEC